MEVSFVVEGGWWRWMTEGWMAWFPVVVLAGDYFAWGMTWGTCLPTYVGGQP